MPIDIPSNDDTDPTIADEHWWLARIGDMLVWARMRVFESGVAQVFDCDSKTVPYDSEDSARAELLDANYRMFDGIDEDDAVELGFELDEVEPPYGNDDEELRERMFSKLPPRG